jgi:ribosomal protein S18 acetylase RimI-like enzyme
VFVIEEATDADAELAEAITRLLPLLSSSAAPPTAEELAQITSSPGSKLLIARAEPGGPIVGTLTLALFRIPSGVRAWIEDVIVAEDMRRRGLAEALTRAALDAARAAGARTVDLTSRPSREAANRLYQRIGFEPRETTVYRYELDS